jgi:hypothetical protein
MTTDTQIEETVAVVILKLDTLNGRVSEEWLLLVHDATPEVAAELADTVFPTTIFQEICEAAELRNGEEYNIRYIVTNFLLTEEEAEACGGGAGVIVTEVDAIEG